MLQVCLDGHFFRKLLAGLVFTEKQILQEPKLSNIALSALSLFFNSSSHKCRSQIQYTSRLGWTCTTHVKTWNIHLHLKRNKQNN